VYNEIKLKFVWLADIVHGLLRRFALFGPQRVVFGIPDGHHQPDAVRDAQQLF
jgi:hypothetical protein